jgi:hypothetical protein
MLQKLKSTLDSNGISRKEKTHRSPKTCPIKNNNVSLNKNE